MNKWTNNLKRSLFSYMSFASVMLFVSRYALALSDPPTFDDLRPIIVRIINILIMCAGGVLVIMVAYGIWKSSLASGDPRGLEGAKSTWTYALYGFFIVVGAFAGFMIIQGIVGISSDSGGLVGNLIDSINELLNIPSSGSLPTP